MSTATATTTRFFERTILSTAKRGRIDRARGVIHGVKILGRFSQNGREYTREAIKRAVGMYEGISVNIDHPDQARRKHPDDRSYRDRIGTIANVRFEEGGLYGDLQINLGHTVAEQLLWDAEHSPGSVGLSHNAEGRTVTKAGKIVVEEITRVHSVDIVANPASTRGLFEDRGPVRDGASFARALTEQTEDDDAPEVTSKPHDAVAASFRGAIIKVVDGEDTIDAKIKKIRDLLKARQKAVETMTKASVSTEDPATMESISGTAHGRTPPRSAREFAKAITR